MRKGIRIGKLFGMNIDIDWSWFFIFVLITWNLAIVFGQAHTDWSLGFRWGLAVIASLLFFASVLAHELAHSLVAKAQGLPVRNITLFLFGGISNIQREPPSPRAEFLITIVGPLTSFIIGFILIFAGGLTTVAAISTNVTNPMELVAQFGPTTTILLWLGWINILLAIFNLIPGFPLDGGRVLRSILWAITNNLRRATRWASWVGQGIAWIFIFMGVSMIFGARIPFFGTGIVGGLWLAFIGWFLNSASIQSYRQVIIQDILEDIPVGQLMRSNPPTVPPNCSIADLVHEHLMQSDEHAFPVVEAGQLVGMVTLEDIRSVSRDNWETTHVQQIMTPANQLATATSEDDAAETLTKLMRRDVRQLPVLSGNHLAGLLRRRDIMKWLQLQSEAI